MYELNNQKRDHGHSILYSVCVDILLGNKI